MDGILVIKLYLRPSHLMTRTKFSLDFSRIFFFLIVVEFQQTHLTFTGTYSEKTSCGETKCQTMFGPNLLVKRPNSLPGFRSDMYPRGRIQVYLIGKMGRPLIGSVCLDQASIPLDVGLQSIDTHNISSVRVTSRPLM